MNIYSKTKASSKGATVKLKGHRGAHSIEASDRRHYSSLAALGIQYGSDFRALSDIRTSEDIDGAAARISLRPSSKSMVHESRYPVHPTTLDGCLQLSVIAAYGRKKPDKLYLPVIFNSLTVWKYPGAWSNLENGTACSHGIRHGLRSVHATTKAVDGDGRLLLEANVTFLSLEGSLEASEETICPQPYSRLVWKPDFDRLMSSPSFGESPEKRLPRYVYENGVTYQTVHEQLTNLVVLLAHKDPRMRILEIGSEIGGATKLIMKGLKGRSIYPNYVEYTLTDVSSVRLDGKKKQFAGCTNMDFRLLDIDRDPVDQGFEANDFDLIIAPSVSNPSTDLSGANN